MTSGSEPGEPLHPIPHLLSSENPLFCLSETFHSPPQRNYTDQGYDGVLNNISPESGHVAIGNPICFLLVVYYHSGR